MEVYKTSFVTQILFMYFSITLSLNFLLYVALIFLTLISVAEYSFLVEKHQFYCNCMLDSFGFKG